MQFTQKHAAAACINLPLYADSVAPDPYEQLCSLFSYEEEQHLLCPAAVLRVGNVLLPVLVSAS